MAARRMGAPMIARRAPLDSHLTPHDVACAAAEGLATLPFDGRRLLVVIPDGTRTMPMPAMFDTLVRELGPRVAALDFLVALGTHAPLDDAQLRRLLGRPVAGGRVGP